MIESKSKEYEVLGKLSVITRLLKDSTDNAVSVLNSTGDKMKSDAFSEYGFLDRKSLITKLKSVVISYESDLMLLNQLIAELENEDGGETNE